MRGGRLICVTGFDGAGKSTLARNLVEALQEKSIPSTYVYGKYVPVIMRPVVWLANRIFLGSEDFNEDYDSYLSTKRRATQSHPVLRTVYLSSLRAEYIVQIALKIIPRLLLGRTVVCDRYVFDTSVMDFGVDFNYTPKEVKENAERLLFICPRPDLTIFIEISEDVALQRKSDIPEERFLEERRSHYSHLVKEFGFVCLPGDLGPGALTERALNCINRTLNLEMG